MNLTAREIMHILECMSQVHGFGYAEGEAGKLQAKLSVMAQARVRLGDKLDEPIPLPEEKK